MLSDLATSVPIIAKQSLRRRCNSSHLLVSRVVPALSWHDAIGGPALPKHLADVSYKLIRHLEGRKVPALVLVEDPREDRGRVEVRDAVAFDCKFTCMSVTDIWFRTREDAWYGERRVASWRNARKNETRARHIRDAESAWTTRWRLGAHAGIGHLSRRRRPPRSICTHRLATPGLNAEVDRDERE